MVFERFWSAPRPQGSMQFKLRTIFEAWHSFAEQIKRIQWCQGIQGARNIKGSSHMKTDTPCTTQRYTLQSVERTQTMITVLCAPGNRNAVELACRCELPRGESPWWIFLKFYMARRISGKWADIFVFPPSTVLPNRQLHKTNSGAEAMIFPLTQVTSSPHRCEVGFWSFVVLFGSRPRRRSQGPCLLRLEVGTGWPSRNQGLHRPSAFVIRDKHGKRWIEMVTTSCIWMHSLRSAAVTWNGNDMKWPCARPTVLSPRQSIISSDIQRQLVFAFSWTHNPSWLISLFEHVHASGCSCWPGTLNTPWTMRVYHTTGSLPPMLQILKSSIDGETGRVFSAESALHSRLVLKKWWQLEMILHFV